MHLDAHGRIAKINFVPARPFFPRMMAWDMGVSLGSNRDDFPNVLSDHISRANQRIRPMMLTSSPLPS